MSSISESRRGNLGGWNILCTRHGRSVQNRVRGFVLLSAVRLRRQERAVRLHEQAIDRRDPRGLAKRIRLLERDGTGKREMAPQVEEALGQLWPLREAVDDAARLRDAGLFEDRETLGVGVTQMDLHGQPELVRKRQMRPEPGPLVFARRMVVVEIEAEFAERRDVPPGGELAQARKVRGTPCLCVVWMPARDDANLGSLGTLRLEYGGRASEPRVQTLERDFGMFRHVNDCRYERDSGARCPDERGHGVTKHVEVRVSINCWGAEIG